MRETRIVTKQSGQASILIAIIFQVLFIFFAMVINVGLLVHDKINLQNSVDVAAYYGAMKQAEVLNVMAHVNYETHSIYKLFNYRLWALANAGRSGWLEGQIIMDDKRATWTGNFEQAPVVCIANNFWYEWYKIKGSGNGDNLCKQASMHIAALPVLALAPIQSAFSAVFNIFQQQSIENHSLFKTDFVNSGQQDYEMAANMLASFKFSAARKRQAMQNLQRLLIGGQGSLASANDFSDIAGRSVKTTVENIIRNNLTSANLKGLSEIDFGNSLYNQPFLVPIEVRTFMKYEDLHSNDADAYAEVKEIEIPPTTAVSPADIQQAMAMSAPDYEGKFPRPSAAAFAGEGNNSIQNLDSLVGFEKDPWTLAYVRVKAQTSPKMLFSPFTSGDNKTVTLTAEAFAMPFGGRIGPWYFDGWASGEPSSMSANQVDALLPPRYDMEFDLTNNYKPPNFSRYPGDALGMRSALAQNALLAYIHSGNPLTDWPHSQGNQYGLISDGQYLNADPVVPDTVKGEQSPVRRAELAAIVPNLFDAVYYSIDANFYKNYGDPKTGIFGGPQLLTQICGGMCNDLGTTAPPVPPYSVTAYISNAPDTGASKEWWLVNNPAYLNSSWTQEGTDLFGQAPTKVGTTKTQGGRTGYSVKIVSKEFLNGGQLPFGGSAGPGSLKNSPTKVFGD